MNSYFLRINLSRLAKCELHEYKLGWFAFQTL